MKYEFVVVLCAYYFFCRCPSKGRNQLFGATKKIKGTQHHHKLIFHLSCHVQRVLVVAAKAEQGEIEVGNERLPVTTGALIARTFTKIEMSCHHRWYMWLLHWIIQSLIQLSCTWFVNSHPALHIKQCMICKLLQYPVGLHLIRQIPCHSRPPRMEVAIFMYAWLMFLSWHWHNYNIMP